jgi:uncharacterized spore protein YtfJ
LLELRLQRSVRTVSIDAGGEPGEVMVASLRARVAWAWNGGLFGFGMGVATPLAIRPTTGPETPVPWTGRSAPGVAAAMICGGAAAPPREESDMDQPERVGSAVPEVSRSADMVKAFTSAATGQGVVGTPTTAGERTAVPLIETMFAGGYGGGGGSDSQGEKADLGAGGGGGGFGRSRTVAILEVAPDGVRVRPVFDQTAVILAAVGALAGVLGAVRHVRRRR